MTPNPISDLPRGGRFILGVIIFGVLATLAYWLVWFGIDREILASAHTDSYYAFENSFPVADAWMVACGVAACIALVRRRASSLLWIIAAGATSIYLGLLDVLFDLENGIYRSPDTGGVLVEVAINVLTLAFGTVIMIWAWRMRRELAQLGGW
jgi:nicotinamide riboside transporter PnuC